MDSSEILRVRGLKARVTGSDANILEGVDISIQPGEIHAIMGPNGSGKSTLAKVIAGHPAYEAVSGSVRFHGADLLDMEPDERAQAGVFMAFQYPVEIPGVSIANFLRTALQARLEDREELDLFDFQELLLERLELLGMDSSFVQRAVNDGFSGGEKKRNEILQMMVLKPALAVMDETDSGLDIDALKIVAHGINTLKTETPDMSALLITHYQRILDHIVPDFVHVMVSGKIVESGGPEVALALEARGYEEYKAVHAA